MGQNISLQNQKFCNEMPGRGAPGQHIVPPCHQKIFFKKIFKKGLTFNNLFAIIILHQMKKGVVRYGNKKNFA